jgi:hypothetical protein
MPADARVTPDEFVLAAIRKLRKPDKSPGIHTVFDKFNEAYRLYYPEQGPDGPVQTVQRMKAEGTIDLIPAFRGVRIYIKGEMPASEATGGKALAAILG